MSSILIKNADMIVTMDKGKRQIKNGDIYIEGCEIKDIGRNLKKKAIRTIKASGMVVYPGFVNTHHHFYQTLTRCIPALEDAKLFDWLTGLYEIWRHLTPEAVYISALVALSELVLTGCTATTDQFYLFPKDQPKDLIDHEIQAAREIGIRFIPTRGGMSCGRSSGGLPPDDVIQSEDKILQDYERLIKKYHDSSKFSMLKIGLGPCSPFSVTKELLEQTARFGKEYRVKCHTHIAETLDEEKYCLKNFGKRPVEYMAELDWLGENFWYAHCIHLKDEEIRLLGKTGTGVAHCPVSNLRLGSGIAPVAKMIDNNVPVGLAVDGSASNDSSSILREMKQALLVHRIKSGVDSMPAERVFEMACCHGSRILGFEQSGSIEKGKAADLAIFQIDGIGYAGCFDPASSLLFAGESDIACYTIINGKIVVENKSIVGLDTEELYHKANRIARKMLQSASKDTGIDYLKRKR
ncbi:MAG: 8-oxoguanine deaminase [Spirochaetes bacterium]|nr:8-oxoguanine deaminase [Spirochaetota bacterium]